MSAGSRELTNCDSAQTPKDSNERHFNSFSNFMQSLHNLIALCDDDGSASQKFIRYYQLMFEGAILLPGRVNTLVIWRTLHAVASCNRFSSVWHLRVQRLLQSRPSGQHTSAQENLRHCQKAGGNHNHNINRRRRLVSTPCSTQTTTCCGRGMSPER